MARVLRLARVGYWVRVWALSCRGCGAAKQAALPSSRISLASTRGSARAAMTLTLSFGPAAARHLPNSRAKRERKAIRRNTWPTGPVGQTRRPPQDRACSQGRCWRERASTPAAASALQKKSAPRLLLLQRALQHQGDDELLTYTDTQVCDARQGSMHIRAPAVDKLT